MDRIPTPSEGTSPADFAKINPMAARLTAVGVRGHPMEQRITEAILNGHTDRSIAAWTIPPISYSTIWKFRKTVVGPALANAESLKRVLPESLRPEENNTETTIERFQQANAEAKSLTSIALMSVPALHIRENRIRAKQERLARLAMIVNGRALEMSVCEHCAKPPDDHPWEDTTTGKRCDTFVEIPGGASGFLAVDYKGKDADRAVYKFDEALYKAFDETEKTIAIELNQWQENTSGAVSIQIVMPSTKQAAAGELPRVEYQARPLELPAADEEDEYEVGLVQR